MEKLLHVNDFFAFLEEFYIIKSDLDVDDTDKKYFIYLNNAIFFQKSLRNS